MQCLIPSNLACFPAESCSQTPASPSARATILAIAGFSSAASQCCCCSPITAVLRWVQSLSSPAPIPLWLLSPSAASPLRATPPFDRDASGRLGKSVSRATCPILGLRKFSHQHQIFNVSLQWPNSWRGGGWGLPLP